MPRYVILTHDHPVLHWDLMLDDGEALRTWRLSRPPDAGGEIAAEPLPPHRRAYLDYEGPVSGGRGEVRRWDAGDYVPVEENESCVAVRLAGAKLNGVARIETTKEDDAGAFCFKAERVLNP